MAEWKQVGDSNLEVCQDGRVRRNGVEFEPCVNGTGYVCVWLNRKLVRLHRLIAISFIPNQTGKRLVDHIDGNPLNNCVENLRWATDSENNRNSGDYRKVSMLPRGVHLVNGRFRARITYERKNYHLGMYDTPEEASEVYETTAEELYGEYYRKP